MKIFGKLKDNKGFTLVELLVVLIVVGLITTAIYSMFSSSGQYMAAIDDYSDYQRLTTETIHRLRVELADCANAQSFDMGKVDIDGTLLYDITKVNTADDDLKYGYIIADPVVINPDGSSSGGGAKLQVLEYDPATNTVSRVPDSVIGKAPENKPYKVSVSFSSAETGVVHVSASIIRTDYKNPDTGVYEAKTVYSQGTDIVLRSGKAPFGQNVLRYTVASAVS